MEQDTEQPGNSKPGSIKSLVSGGVGGIFLVLVGHPFDLVKVKIQTGTGGLGMHGIIKNIVAQDGFKGLYRGMASPLMSVTPVFAMCFWSYDLGQKIARRCLGYRQDDQLGIGAIALAGGFSAFPTTVLATPSERLKVMMQIQAPGAARYRGPLHILRSIVVSEGRRAIPTLYQGTMATIARDVPGSVAYFATYEAIKRTLTRIHSPDHGQTPIHAVLLAGGLAGMANWTVAIPADVIKTRIQAGSGQTGLQILRQLLRTEGVGALFRGLGPSLVRAFPANAACFAGVELSLKLMGS